MNFFQLRKFLKQANYLEMIPVRRIDHELSGETEQTVTLVIPKFKNENLRLFFIPRSRSQFLKVRLDADGSNVWLMIDGQRNVGEICNLLNEKFEGDLNETRVRVTKFLTKLYDNRYITYQQLL
jgi:hypothetical protein